MSEASGSDDFEFIDTVEIARQIADEKKPDILKIRAWLDPTDYEASSSEYKRHLSSQAPQTGEWIRQTSQFERWHSSNDHASIWIKAVPGAGKSVVAASMANSLAQIESVPVLFFFFRQIIESNRSSKCLLRDWLAQLLPHSEILQVSLWDIVEENMNLESMSVERLWQLLLTALRNLNRVYCVVDALDEMDFDEDFLNRLDALGSFQPATVKVLMTSRPKQHLQSLMKHPRVIHVDLEEELVKRDISVFVRQRISLLYKCQLFPQAQEMVIQAICERSRGLFLYARLILDQISKSVQGQMHNESSLADMLSKLPIGLEEMYNTVLHDQATACGISESIQLFILQLVTHSARPMRLIEIASALEMRSDCIEMKISGKDIVRIACGPLLEIMEDEIVQILHHSFTEFLLDSNRARRQVSGTSQFPVINELEAHHQITLTCLNYLEGCGMNNYFTQSDSKWTGASRQPSSHEGATGRFNSKQMFLQCPLAEYAAKKWTYHARRCMFEKVEFFTRLEQFCDPDTVCFRGWQELTSKGKDSSISKTKSSFLHIAAGHGLSLWVKHLVKKGSDVNALDGMENTPLYWAAKGGYDEVVKILLNAGAKADVDGYDGFKPIHVAAKGNHASIVKLLLEAGVSPTSGKPREIGRMCGNAPSTIGHHGLMFASQQGHVETVLEMVPYAETEDLNQAVCWAAAGGHSSLVAALLKNSSATPDAVSKIGHHLGRFTGGETALQMATRSLYSTCVEVLLQNGASVYKISPEITTSGKRQPTATYTSRPRAQQPGRRSILHYLAEARLKSREKNLGDNNVTAAREILVLLLKAGADLEARDATGATPLLVAMAQHIPAPELLHLFVEAGADVNAVDWAGDSLLHRLCKISADTKLSEQLLNWGANPKQRRSSDGATPLHWNKDDVPFYEFLLHLLTSISAMENLRGPLQFLQLLVDHGADVNAVDFLGNTPLMTAFQTHISVDLELISASLKSSADINIQNINGKSCIHLLIAQSANGGNPKCCEVLKYLLDNGADAELRTHAGLNSLHLAVSMCNNITILDTLLSHKRAPLISARTHFDGKSVLHLACRKVKPFEFIEILLKHGADPTWKDHEGNSLLHEAAAVFDGGIEKVALLKTLVGLKVSINARNNRGQTCLHRILPMCDESRLGTTSTTRKSFFYVLNELSCEFDINIRDFQGYTPLHYASTRSEAQVLGLLCAGANINAKSYNLRTPLHCAARARQSNILAMILQFATDHDLELDVNAADVGGVTPLIDACRSGRPESVSILVNAGANVNQKDLQLRTPLMACADHVEEDQLWRVLATQHGTLKDDFRPVSVIPGGKGADLEDGRCESIRIAPILKTLINAGSSTDGIIKAAVKSKNTEMLAALQLLQRKGVQFMSEDHQGFEDIRALPLPQKWTEMSRSAGGTANDLVCSVDELDEQIVDDLLERRIDFCRPNEVFPATYHDPVIAKFAAMGMTELMKKVLDQAKLFDEPESNPTNNDSVRPLLQIACRRKLWNMDMVRLLVEEGGVNVNAHGITKHRETKNPIPASTALHVLAQGDSFWQVEAIKYLVDKGAKLNARDENGRSPLSIASSQTYYRSGQRLGLFRSQCCEMLLQLGADPNIPDEQGWSPLNHASQSEDVVKSLLTHGAAVHNARKGVLISAIESNALETLRILLENGADCNIADSSGDRQSVSMKHNIQHRFPLLVAAQKVLPTFQPDPRVLEMTRLLLSYGARCDAIVSEEATLVHHLFETTPSYNLQPFLEMVQLDINMRDQRGRTIFMAACQSKLYNITERAFARKDIKHIPAFLKLADSPIHGPKIDYAAVDNQGKHSLIYLLPRWTPEVQLRFSSLFDMQKLVLQKDGAGFSPLHHALKIGQIDAAALFIDEYGADALEPDPNGDTILHHLCRGITISQMPEPRLSLAKRFLTVGGSINARNNEGETAFLAHLKAGRHPQEEKDYDGDFTFFKSHSADFCATYNNGETALHIVAKMSACPSTHFSETHSSTTLMFKDLVDLGCDSLREDGQGRTALDVAAATGKETILNLFKRKRE